MSSRSENNRLRLGNHESNTAKAAVSVLVHLHPDFQESLEDLLDAWNNVQQSWRFVGLRPGREFERFLLVPGSISDGEASLRGAAVRKEVGHSDTTGIIIFTEKRLFDEDYYQLFVGGREADEDPSRVAVLSLDFLRKMYAESQGAAVLFRAIASNLLFSLGVDCGLREHQDETRACIMDFCMNMTDIEIGLRNGPRFCDTCSKGLQRRDRSDLMQLANVLHGNRFILADAAVSKSILLRGARYTGTDARFDYDVALSFAGPDRESAERLAEALQRLGVAVFYDQFDQATLWGKNLHSYLTELYHLRSKFCVVFLSASYGRKGWTRVELEAALAREFKEGCDYILPIRLDDTDIPGILPTRGYMDWRQNSVESIVELIRVRLANSALKVTGPSLRSGPAT
ncbi:MAG TPA: TIR domain-containing protein [Fibrobacteria bacterium]|nr:TIR domain-containing protein [Fibrobacteria bacterium]